MDIFSSSKLTSVAGGVTATTAGANMASMVQARNQQQLQTKMSALGDSYSGRLRDVSDQITRLQNLQTGISAAINSLRSAKSSADSLVTLFSQMQDTVTSAAGQADTSSIGARFQSQMNTLRNLSKSSDDNLLSGSEKRVSYAINNSGTEVEVRGNAMGSSYTIVASDGNVWAPATSGTALVAYSEYPAKLANKSSGFQGGTKLHSLAGDGTIDFTVMANSATPTHLTGKLQAKGIGIYDSWIYDDFSTEEGRKRATTDLNAATGAAKVEALRYQSAADMAQYYYDKMELAVGVLNGEQIQLTEEQGEKANELQEKFNQTQAALALAFQGAANSGVQLLTILPSGNSILSPASTDSTFDIFA